MKKFLLLILVLVLTAFGLTACAKPLAIDGTNITEIALTSGEVNLSVAEIEWIQSIVNAINNASPTPDDTLAEELPEEVFTFTLFSDNTPQASCVLFSSSLMQIGDTLYHGDFASLVNLLSSYLRVSSLEDLSDIFSVAASELEEIAFHNHKDGSYKVITDDSSRENVLSALQSLQAVSDTDVGTPTKEYTVYVRVKGEAEYRAPIILSSSADTEHYVVSCNGKTCTVQAPDSWDTLYKQLDYNTMPIPQ